MEFRVLFQNRSPFALKCGEPVLNDDAQFISNGDYKDIAPHSINWFPDGIQFYFQSKEGAKNQALVKGSFPITVVGQNAGINIEFDSGSDTDYDGLSAHLSPDPDPDSKSDLLLACHAIEADADLKENIPKPNEQKTQTYLVYFYSPGPQTAVSKDFDFEWGQYDAEKNKFVPKPKPNDVEASINAKGEVEIKLTPPRHVREYRKIASIIEHPYPQDFSKEGGHANVYREIIQDEQIVEAEFFPRKFTLDGMQLGLALVFAGKPGELINFRLKKKK